MTRFLLLFVALTLCASAPVWETANRLAGAYRVWTDLRNARVGSQVTVDTVSVPEFMAWQKVKAAWRELEKEQDAEYRGER